MKKRNLPKTKSSDGVRREKDPIPWRYCLLTLCCGGLVVGGFFVAARSHFAAIDFGIKNSTLKKQLEDLGNEKRRLTLLREIALTPAEIKKAAKKLGLTEITASSFSNVTANSEPKIEKPQTAKKNEEKPKPLVEKTVQTKPVEKIGKDGDSKNVSTTTAKRERKERIGAMRAQRPTIP